MGEASDSVVVGEGSGEGGEGGGGRREGCLLQVECVQFVRSGEGEGQGVEWEGEGVEGEV